MKHIFAVICREFTCLWIKIEHFVLRNRPTWCQKCGYLMFFKDCAPTRSTTGDFVILCPTCHDELFKIDFHK